MAVYSAESVDVPLSLFSSLDTELSPPDLPEGISPDNQDIIYLPGSVATRPGLSVVFSPPLAAGAFVSYQKSFVTPTKVVKNLYLVNTGALYVEDETNSPGTATLLFQSTASMASSVTAFGREYIALSDGVHGADVPIQYDGTNLWRVTQDAPGAPPTVVSVALPPSTLDGSGSGGTGGSVTSVYVGSAGTDYFYGAYAVFSGGGGSGASAVVNVLGGVVFSITLTNGGSGYTSAPSLAIYPNSSGVGFGATATCAISTISGTISLSRANNTVSATTTTAHGLQVGYQTQIGAVPALVVGGSITSIVLNNEDNPGIATVTMTSPHGLLPNNAISITGVSTVSVGGGITNIAFAGDLITVTTSSPHGLQVGAQVNVSAVTTVSANGQWYVTSVPSPTTFTYVFVSSVTAFTVPDTGSVNYNWPLANVNPELNYFTVLTAPSATTFTIALSYTDGTWTGGTVTFAWDGIFYVTSVPSALTFTYQQYGPNGVSYAAGTVTPFGQATPGIHQVQQCFLLLSGAITAPSPPSTFIANGGQYLSVTNLAIGPSNVAARILLFTGAGGAYFFYIPQPAVVNGITVSTATQINDNTTATAILDFGDPTLYRAIACSIPGNNLASQVVLGPCAGVFTYASRLQAWGEYNKVQNFNNMGFGGGSITTAPTLPLGWTVADANGALAVARLGMAWRMTVGTINVPQGKITQSAFEDAYGNPILQPNTYYRVRLWAKASVANPSLSLYVLIQSAAGFFTTFVTFTGAQIGTNGSWLTGTFSIPTGSTVFSDTLFSVYTQGNTTTQWIEVSELEVIFDAQPFVDHRERLSYLDNPEAFDGLTGVMGPADDLSPIMNHGVLRNTLYIVTGNGVHETNDNGTTEPSGWNVEQLDDECGAYSIAAVARNPQGIGSAGKGFMAWAGPDGAHIFTGHNPEKVSQEIQSLWDKGVVDQSRLYQIWAKNDQTNKRLYFGVPLLTGGMRVLPLDYRNLPGDNIGSMPPIHISFTGKMIASDLTRKWTRWNVNAYCGELMYRPGNAQPVMVFGGVNPSGAANIYTLDPTKHSDDDFGQILAYYVTYFFVSHEMEQGLQLGSHRKQYEYISAFVSAIGTVAFTPLLCSLSNAQAATPNQVGNTDPQFDYESGINVITSRCAFKIAATPLTGQTDSYFNLQKLIINMRKAPWQPVRGSAGGGY